MANNTEAFLYSYEILPSDWQDFLKRITRHPNAKYGKAKDENGHFEYILNKASNELVAKWYDDDFELVTDITKRDYYRYTRGANIDIFKLVTEGLYQRYASQPQVVLEMRVNELIPVHYVANVEEAKSVVENYSNHTYMSVKAFRHDMFKRADAFSDNILEKLSELEKNYVNLTEGKVETETQLKKYIDDRLKQKFGDKFDQEISDKIFNGLKEKYKGNFGAAVGALK